MMIQLNESDVLLFIGDSITHGGRLPSMDLNHIMGHGFAEMVCARMGARNLEKMPRFINKGISGNTSSQILSRWDADALAYEPTVINLLAGVNDALHAEDFGTAVSTYRASMEAILERTRRALPKALLFLCEPFYLDARNPAEPYRNIPHAVSESDFVFGNIGLDDARVNALRSCVEALAAELPRLCEMYGATLIPLQGLFDEAAQKTAPSYLIWDNVHPTMVGHRLIADRWLELAAPVFNGRSYK